MLSETFSVSVYRAKKTEQWHVNIHRMPLAERYAKATNKAGICPCDKSLGKEFQGLQYAQQYATELSEKYGIPIKDYARGRYYGEKPVAPVRTVRPRAEQPKPAKLVLDVLNPTTRSTTRNKQCRQEQANPLDWMGEDKGLGQVFGLMVEKYKSEYEAKLEKAAKAEAIRQLMAR